MKTRLAPSEQRWGLARLGLSVLGAGMLAGQPAIALDPACHLQQYNCSTWTRQNGLPASGISAITQTTDGYLWFGTSLGLVRFDGLEFHLVDFSQITNLHSTVVTSLSSRRAGGVWVGLNNGLFGYFDGQAFTSCVREEHGIQRNIYSILETADQTVWVVADSQLGRLSANGQFEIVQAGAGGAGYDNLLCGCQGAHGRLWFGTKDGSASGLQAGREVRLTDPELETVIVFCVAEDLEGNLWLGTNHGLFCYDSNLHRRDIPPLTDEVRALLVDRHGALWIGTSGHGVGRYLEGRYEFLHEADGLASNFINALAEDREGSLWIGTRRGISQLLDVKFPTVNAAEDPLVQDALAVAASQRGGVWIGSPGGLTYYDGSEHTYTTADGLPRDYVKRVFEARDGVLYLVCGSHQLTIFASEHVVANYTNSNMVVGMAEDPSGVVVSVGDKLYRAGTNYFQPYTFADGEQPPLFWVLNLASGRDGVIWAATGNGIFRISAGTFQPPPTNLAGVPVLWVCEDKEGVVWGATFQGIVRLKDGQARFINRSNGLIDDNIYSFMPDEEGRLWVSSRRGVFSVDLAVLNDFADGKTDHVDCATSYNLDATMTADNAVQEFVACKTSDGRIWFPCPRGVLMVDPAHLHVNRVAPPVHIRRVLAEGHELAAGIHRVPPGRGELEFHFDALSFVTPQAVPIRYQLEGYDQNWVAVTNRRTAYYTNLKPGRYKFRVIAANADGVWNQEGAALAIELEPHFYQTLWFGLLGGGLGLAALVGVYFGRIRHLDRKQRALRAARDRLEEEVKHRTAELARRTRSLEHEIEERKQMQLEVDRVHRQLLETSRLAGMAEVATNVLHNVGNVLNSVNVSATLATDIARQSKAVNVAKVVELLDEHADDLAGFMTRDPKGVQLHAYLRQLSKHLAQEQAATIEELDSLRKNIDHIKDIVSMQQDYARMAGVREVVSVADLVEDSLRMNEGSLERHGVKVIRNYQEVPSIEVEKHKVLQILVNLIRNAKFACVEGAPPEKCVTVRIDRDGERIRIAVSDNGIGIPSENLTRIFSHGFTTRKGGHGFGLHSGALAAREMGGTLDVSSPGLGGGATFTLTVPINSKVL